MLVAKGIRTWGGVGAVWLVGGRPACPTRLRVAGPVPLRHVGRPSSRVNSSSIMRGTGSFITRSAVRLVVRRSLP